VSGISAPTISVLIPAYNCAHLLPRAVRSAYAQTLPPFEVVVVDDGSTDETPAVLAALAEDCPANFVVETKPNGGEASARNRCVELAKGEYVAFIDQDDVWHPTKLERQMVLFERDPGLTLTFTAYNRVSPEGSATVLVDDWGPTPEEALHRLMVGCCITPSTVVVRRHALSQVGGFDESYWAGSDWTMWLALASAGLRAAYLPEPLVEYHVHATNMSLDQRKTALSALTMFERFFRNGQLPRSVSRRRRWCLARWNMIAGLHAADTGDRAAAIRHLTRAALLRPLSIRPGWVRPVARAGRGKVQSGALA
jgi:teichuronic acid biosynthesis glycosyltransferase TuaG